MIALFTIPPGTFRGQGISEIRGGRLQRRRRPENDGGDDSLPGRARAFEERDYFRDFGRNWTALHRRLLDTTGRDPVDARGCLLSKLGGLHVGSLRVPQRSRGSNGGVHRCAFRDGDNDGTRPRRGRRHDKRRTLRLGILFCPRLHRRRHSDRRWNRHHARRRWRDDGRWWTHRRRSSRRRRILAQQSAKFLFPACCLALGLGRGTRPALARIIRRWRVRVLTRLAHLLHQRSDAGDDENNDCCN